MFRLLVKQVARQQTITGIPWTRRSSSLGPVTEFAKSIFKNRQHTPEDGFVWNSPYEPISLPDMTVDQYVWKNMVKWPNKVAMVCSVTGRKYTYAKMRDNCAALAIRLRTEFGLKQGDVVAICLPNTPGMRCVIVPFS